MRYFDSQSARQNITKRRLFVPRQPYKTNKDYQASAVVSLLTQVVVVFTGTTIQKINLFLLTVLVIDLNLY